MTYKYKIIVIDTETDDEISFELNSLEDIVDLKLLNNSDTSSLIDDINTKINEVDSKISEWSEELSENYLCLKLSDLSEVTDSRIGIDGSINATSIASRSYSEFLLKSELTNYMTSNEFDTEKNKVESQINNFENLINTLETNISNLNTNINSLKSQYTQLSNTISSYEESFETAINSSNTVIDLIDENITPLTINTS